MQLSSRRFVVVDSPLLLGALFLSSTMLFGISSAQSAGAKARLATPKIVTQRVTLRYVTPSQIVAILGASKTPSADASSPQPTDGALTLIVGGKNSRLTLKGSPGAVANTQKIIALLDKPTRQVQVRLRLLRRPAPDLTNGAMLTPSASDEIVQSSFRTVANNELVSLVVSRDNQQWNVQATPHINGDNSVTFGIKVTRHVATTLVTLETAPSQNTRLPAQTGDYNLALFRRTANNTPFRVTAFLDEAYAAPADEGSRGLYIVEVTPVVKGNVKTK